MGIRHNSYSVGFTLVEVLLATVVGSLVIVSSLLMFRSVLRSREALGYASRAGANGRCAMNRIRNDLANVYRGRDRMHMRFVGTKAGVAKKGLCRLSLTIVGNGYSLADDYTGDIFEVEYGLIGSGDVSVLGRRCSPLAHGGLSNDHGVLTRIAENISQLEFKYYDGQQWLDRWEDSDDFPQLILVSLAVVDPAGVYNPLKLSQIISLPPMPTVTVGNEDTSGINLERGIIPAK